MTADELYTQLEMILVGTLGVTVADVTPEATYGALGIDSLGLIEMILIVEDDLGIRVDDEQLQAISTLRQLSETLAANSRMPA